VDSIKEHQEGHYQPLSNSSLVTQVIVLNLLDALLTLYATMLGVGELNPLMSHLLTFGPELFLSLKVLLVTSCILVINGLLGHSGRHVYICSALLYWLVLAWHTYGVLALWGAPTQ
jgi:hypothetical protein